MSAPYLIWSNEHRAWWAPNRQGYTTDVRAAGRYERSEAISIAGTARGGWERGKNPDEIALPEADAMEQAMHPDRLEAWRAENAARCDCGQPATVKYDGDHMCEACARYCARRDFEEADMPGGFA